MLITMGWRGGEKGRKMQAVYISSMIGCVYNVVHLYVYVKRTYTQSSLRMLGLCVCMHEKRSLC